METLLVALLTIIQPQELPTSGTTTVERGVLEVSPTPKTEEPSPLVKKLMAGVKALEFKSLVLSEERRKAIAEAALAAATATKVDPFLLIAVARMESDFVAIARTAYQCKLTPKFICSADCGITQHHVSGKGTWVIKYCNELQRDMKLSFLKSAEELARHVDWCQQHSSNSWYSPLEQCVLNRYNQGPYYRRDSECSKTEPGMDRAAASNVRRRCLIKAAYWKRVLCFYYGSSNGTTLKKSCRYCMDVKDIPWYYDEPKTVAYVMPPVFKPLVDSLIAAQNKPTTAAPVTTATPAKAAPSN